MTRIFHFLFLSAIILSSIPTCSLNEPDYNLDFGRSETAPKGVFAMPIDLFSIEIVWSVDELDHIEKFIIYRFASLSEASATPFEQIQTLSIDDIQPGNQGKYSFVDSNVVPGRYYYYQITAQYGKNESLVSVTALCHFVIPPPTIETSIEGSQGNILRQRIEFSDSGFDALELSRFSASDTLIREIEQTVSSGEFILDDTLQFSFADTISKFQNRALFEYENIIPNNSYTYQVRGITYQDTTRRSTSYSDGNEVSILLDYPSSMESMPLSSESARIYLSDFEIQPYDSILIYSASDNYFVYEQALSISDMHRIKNLGGEELIVFDFYVSDPLDIRVVFWNEYAHSYSIINDSISTIPVMPLGISGFRLIEEGYLNPGCHGVDCSEGIFPIEKYYLATYETTNIETEQWPPNPGEMPLENISWQDALIFCSDLSLAFPGYSFTLPSEAEWEYAAKFNPEGMVNATYPWGEILDIYHANYGNAEAGVIGVGSYAYTCHFGLYDMAGNAFEWVMDGYSEEFNPGSATSIDENYKMIRGGGYWSNPEDVRTISREFLPVSASIAGVGFRVKMTMDGEI